MATLQFIGAMDTITNDIVTILKKDQYLQSWEIYPTETLINITSDVDNKPTTPIPCTSVELSERTESEEGYCGQTSMEFEADGRIIVWFPTEGDESLPSLNELGERVDYILRTENSMPDYITEYNFGKAYQVPLNIPVTSNGMTKLKTHAYLIVVECIIKYKVVFI